MSPPTALGRCACALLLLGAAPAQRPGQQPAQQPAPAAAQQDRADPAADVEKACTARRYGLRLAAARKVGAAGAAAVPAIRAWQQAHGDNSLPVALVEAVADRAGNDPAVLGLLEDWSSDPAFYWRAQALRGLAERAVVPELAARYLGRFTVMADDPAWLVRVYARHGWWRAVRHLDETPPAPFAELTDPRARTKLAALQGRTVALLEALGDQRTFLGDPWGRRRAAEAFDVLRRLADTDYRPGKPFAANADAIRTLTAAVRAVADAPVPDVTPQTDPDLEFAGGVEILSCRHGDLFLRWTSGGAVYRGLEPGAPVRLDAAAWAGLSQDATAIALAAQSGVVICDRMRLVPGGGHAQAAVAPGALPAEATAWLKRLAAAIEEAGDRELAAALRERLTQFASS